MASYEERRDFDAIWAGDTLDAVTFQRAEVPVSVCAQIRSQFGTLMHTWAAEIDPDGTITLPMVQTQGWPVAIYKYDLEYRLADGKVRTFYGGNITLVGHGSSCL